ncbi:outer membrane protein [Pseudothioclava arenosa]|nr:outer membrane beta-barrel protein [Pseudothioclava arenosa]
MKLTALVVAGSALFGALTVSPALAQDAANWTGFYAGAFAGYGGSAWDRETPAYTDNVTSEWRIDGANLGLFGGYNWQRGNLVLGLEAEVATSGVKGDDRDLGGILDGIDVNRSAGLGARIGYAADRNMFYLTAGKAWYKVDQMIDTATLEHDLDGHYVGLGIEHAYSDKILLRGELRQTTLDDFAFDAIANSSGGSYQMHDHTEVRIGASYKF